jgi:nicotinamidase/pyrazinamidase
MTSALVIIDMLNDFVKPGGALPVKDAEDIVKNIKKIKAAVRKTIYGCDSHNSFSAEINTYGLHAISGTPGSLIVNELQPDLSNHDEIVLSKDTHSITSVFGFGRILSDWNISTVFFTGVVTEICIAKSALKTKELYPSKNIFVVYDCVKPLIPEDGKAALKEMEAAGIILCDSKTIISLMKGVSL